VADERFRPQGQDDLAPSGQMARIRANLEALRTLRALQTQGRPATPAEQSVLARWSSWGAVPNVFLEDRDPETGELTEASKQFEWARTELRELLFEGEYEAARRTTINAHYTDASLVRAIWQGLERLGFEGGRVLEPGCGSGHFIGMAPATASMVGVELDPITGGIAAALYPDADIRIESFADTRIREGTYDAAIGNVPFAKVALNDRRYNPDRRYSMHSHFILKSLHAVRPGGMVALLTSRYTMDAGNDPESAAADARREMAELADLVTAVRLPAGAHRRAAGTDVVTDLLVLRRREPGRDPASVDWQKVVTIDLDGAPVEVNQYFADHPEQILGTLTTGRGQFSDHELTVRADPDIDVADALAEALETAASRAAKTDLLMSPPEVPIAERPIRRASDLTIHGAEADRFEGLIVAHDDGTFSAVRDGETKPFAVPASQADELRALIGLRDAVTALLDAEAATTEDTDDIAELRARLNEHYDAYVAAYGPINRFTWSPRIRDTDEGRELREQLLAEGHARYTGGTFVLHQETADDLARRDELLAQEHAVLKDGKLRMRQTKAAREVRARLLAEGHAHIEGGTFTLTDTGRAIAASAPAEAVNKVATFPPQGGFRTDPYAPAVFALEDFDADTGTARKAAIFSQRVIAQRKPTERTDDPADAVAISRDVLGRVDLDYVTLLLGEDSPEAARARLGELVFDEPGTGRLIPRSEYLSGNVRTKLAKAEELAELDPKFQANVAALRSVLPPDLDAGDIDARLGSPWIDAAIVQQGLQEILEDSSIRVSRGVGASWTIEGGNKHSVMATDVYGTKERNAIELAHALLEGRPIRVNAVFDKDDTPQARQRKAQWAAGETAVAQAKAEELNNAFTEWLWDDPQRSAELVATYNFKFNSLVSRSYDDARPALPGLTAAGDLKPRPHQLAAVARIVSEPTALLAHEVGAGKTLEMVMGAMELRRLGMARKPTIVVPNHMLEQFSREFLQAYPQARILAVGKKDLTKEKRRRTVARIATGDWDAVIMSRSVFERIPMSAERQKRYIDHQLAKLDAWLARQPPGSNKKMVKRMEAKRLAREEALKKRLESAKDSGISFEQTGIDYLFIDEAHGYKNLSLPSNNQELAIDGSGRSTDLDMKLDYLREVHGQRVATFATATPISNSMSEMFIMLQYLRPDLLEEAGLDDFDSWIANHGEVISDVEVSPEGGVRVKGRFQRYRNVPELLRMFHTFADVKTAADLNLPVPALVGDAPEVVVVPASFEQHQFMAELSDRAEQVRNRRVHPSEDNLLKISSDGRAAALDLRLVERESDAPGKLDIAAERIAGIWVEHRDDVFYTKDENGLRIREEITGSLQIVFCDLGTPKEGRTNRNANEYETVRAKLHAAGVAEGMLAELDEMFHATEPPEQQAWEDLHDRLWDAVGLTEDDIGTSVGPNADAKALFTRVVGVFNERSALRRSGDWSAYSELKDQLVARGIPAEQIRFMQEARTDQDKADLFAAARAGKVAVLIGSTELMGVGTNVQRRAVALHHLDCPWRPADVDQREGRIRRQGNQHDAVRIIRYVTEGSFDAYMWQTVERKQKFIAQVMKGKLDTRDMEAIDEAALSYSEVKALASGDMRLLAKAKVDQEVQKLERLESSHRRSQQSMRGRIQAGEAAITALTAKLDNIATALDRRIDTRGDAFSIRLGPQTFTERPKAAATLIETIRQEVVLAGVNPDGTLQPLGTLGGFDLSIAVRDREVSLILHGLPDGTVRLPIADLPRDGAPVGLITRLENKLAGLEKLQATTAADLERAKAEVERARANLGKPFPHTEALAQARAEAAELAKELGAESQEAPTADPGEGANGEGLSGTTLSPEDAAAFSDIANAFTSSTAAEPEPRPGPSDSTGITGQPAEREPASRIEPPSIADLEPVAQGYQDADQVRAAYAAINAAMAAFVAHPFEGTFAQQHAHRQVTDAIALVTARDGMGTRAGAYDRFDTLRAAARRFAESVDDPAAEAAAALAELLDDHTERARLAPASLEAWYWPPSAAAADSALDAAQEPQPARSDSVGIAAGTNEPTAEQPADDPQASENADSGLIPAETRPSQPVAEPKPAREAVPIPSSAAEAPAPEDQQRPESAPEVQPYDEPDVWNAADRLIDLRNEIATSSAYEAMEIDDRDGLARRYMARWGNAILSVRQGLPQHIEATRQALDVTRDVLRALERYYDPDGAGRLLDRLIEQTEHHLARLDATQAAASATEPAAAEPAPEPVPADPESHESEQNTDAERNNPVVIEHNRTTTLVHRTRKEDLAVRKALSNNGFRWSSNIGDEGAWYLPRPWKYHTRDNRVSRLRRDLERLGTAFVVQTTPPTEQSSSASAPILAPEPETIQADPPLPAENVTPERRDAETRTAGLTSERRNEAEAEPEQSSDSEREEGDPQARPLSEDEPAPTQENLAGLFTLAESPAADPQTESAPPAEAAAEEAPGAVAEPEPEPAIDSVGITTQEPETADAPPGPLTDDDIRVGLRTQVTAWKLAHLVRALDDPDSLRAWMQHQAKNARSGYVGNRPDNAPGAPAHDRIDETRRGIRIRVATPNGRREGTITWKQVAERVGAALTPDLARELLEVDDAARAAALRVTLDDGSDRDSSDIEMSVQLGRQLRAASEAIHDAIDAAGPPPRRRAARSRQQSSARPQPEQGDLFTLEEAPEPGPTTADGTTPAADLGQGVSEAQDPGQAADSVGITTDPALPATAAPEISDEEIEDALDDPDAEYDEEEDYELLYPEEFELTAPDPPPSTAGPLTEADIAFAVRSYLDPWGVVEATAGALGDPVTIERWVERGIRHSGGSATVLPEGHPDAGASVSMGMRRNGLYCHVFAADGSRKGTIPWTDTLEGVRGALTTERVNALFAAENAHRALWDDWQFAVDDPEAWETQNRQIERELITAGRTILDAIQMPQPGSRPQRPAAPTAHAEPTLFEIDDVQPLEGTIALRPRSTPRYKTPAEIEVGDMLIHPGYAGGPFIVREIAHRGGSTVLTGEVYYIGRPPFREPWTTDATMVIRDDLDERIELAPARLDPASARDPQPETERQQESALTQEAVMQAGADGPSAPEPQPAQEPEAAPLAAERDMTVDVASTTPTPEESTTPPQPADVSDSVGIASARDEAVPSREGTPVAEEPQQLTLAVPVAPVFPEIDEPTYEAAIARADAAVDALRMLWRIGPGALGFPEGVHDAIRAAWQQAGQQAAARADDQRGELAAAFQTVQAEAENTDTPGLHEPELPAETGQSAADAQPDADESRTAAYLADYRAGRPPRDEAAAEAYREWRQLDAEDQEAALEALNLENEYERYQGPLSWSEWLQQRDDPEVDFTEENDEAGPQQDPQHSASPPAGRGEDGQQAADEDAPRSDTAEGQEATEPDEPRPTVEPDPAATAEDERAGTAQAPAEVTADEPDRDDQQQDTSDEPEGEGTMTDQQATAIPEQDDRDRAEDFFAQVNQAIDQLRADLDDALAEEPAAQDNQADPLGVFADALAQLGVEVDLPGTEQPTPDLGLDGLTEVEQAYTAASRHAREYNGAPEWRQLNQLWQSTQRFWANARDVLARYGTDLATDIRWHGMLRTVGMRAADAVARLSNRLAERLSRAGRHNSPGHRALQGLSRAAQNFAARLRGHNPAERFATFDSLAESIRDLRADLTRDPDQPQATPAATAPGQPTPPQDFDAFRLVGEAFDGASRHAREYNGAPEWRRLTTVWPTATRVLGEHRVAAVARYGADLATDIRWRGIERTAAIRSVDTVARLSNRLAERLSNAGRHDSPGYRAIQALGHAAQRAASALRGEDPAERAERVAAFDRLIDSLRDLRADLAQISLDDDGPDRGGDGPGPGAIPFGEPTRPTLQANGQATEQNTGNGHGPGTNRPALTGTRTNGPGLGE
jgi:N12 class adenine-specific DNA methylase